MAEIGPGWMASLLRGPIARQLAAAVAVALALLLRLVLAQQSITLPTYITFYPALIFAALVGGMGAGILATALSALLVDFLLLAPVGHFRIGTISDAVGMAIFCISGVSISVVMELYHRSRERLAAYQTEMAVLNERRKVDQERALAESMRAERQRFLDVLETLPAMISLLTTDHKIAFANRSFRERFGVCQGLHCHETCYGRTEPCEFCESYTVLNTGQPHHWEMIFEDGSLIDAYDYPFTDLDGSSLVLQMGVDITERRRAENALETHREELEALVSERTRQLQTANLQLESDVRKLERAETLLEATMQRFYRMLSNLNAGVLVVTGDERIEFANQAYCDIFALDESPADLVVSFSAERMIERIKTVYQNPDQAVHRVRKILDQGLPVLGEEVHMQNGATYLRDFVPLTVDGKSYGRMWVHTDITERLRIEQELAKASLQAERSALQLRTIFENVQERLYVCDSAGNVILANDVARQSYGMDEGAVAPSVDEMQGCIDVFDLQGSPMPKAAWPISRVLRGEQVHSAEIRVQFRHTNQEHVLSCSGSAICDQIGNITMAVLTSVDITEAKRGELQLKRLNRTLTALSNSNLAILHAVNEADFLNEVCRIVTRDCGHTMVWIGIAENDENKTVRPLDYSGLDEVYMENLLVTWDDSERGRGPAGTAIRTGEPSICRDILTDAAFSPWRNEAVKRGYASSLAIPLKEQNKTWGAIVIHSRQPDAFSAGEVVLLTELAADIDVGIQTLRMRAARAQAEEWLRESTELLELFVVHAPAALAMFDREMRYLHASRRWKADYGLGDRDLHGVSHYDVFPEISNIWKQAHRCGLAGEIVGGEADRFERADGSVQWVHWEVRPWHDAEGKVGGIVIFSEDITARKKAEEALLRSEKETLKRQQLQALAQRLRQAREEERKMVARDLHDDIGQILTAIKMDLSWVMRHLSPEEGNLRDRLERSIALVDDGVFSVRKICGGLRPGILDDLGLVAAIDWQMNEFASRTGISCQFTVPSGELHLESDRSTAIFRIFQESLTNIARHAEANSVRASLYEQDENLVLIVEDNGKGFQESEIAKSLGILGMKERAAACGGAVQVSSNSGNGTRITVRVPIHIVNDEREDHAHSDSR